jgi:hypothetical protein
MMMKMKTIMNVLRNREDQLSQQQHTKDRRSSQAPTWTDIVVQSVDDRRSDQMCGAATLRRRNGAFLPYVNVAVYLCV